MKIVISFCLQVFVIFFGKAQGLINNGAQIVLTNASNLYIDGVAGNYTNQAGGLINNNTVGGTITLLGNWINNAANLAFSNDGATVKLGGANQSVGGTNSTTFYNLTQLGSGVKTLNINTTVGGISTLTGVLLLGALPMDLNSRTLTITNPLISAITFGTGYIISETNVAINPSIVTWNMGTNTGAHVYPFGVSGTQIPFTFNKTTAGSSNVSVSTRATAASNNLPWAGVSSVAAVTNMYCPLIAADGSVQSVIDRWWDVTTSSPTTADLVFSYRGSENTTSIAPLGTFGAQHWNGAGWDAPLGSGFGVTAGVGTVSVPGANTFSPWVLSSSIAILPVEIVEFNAECDNAGRLVKWTTASEKDNSYFIVERSEDGLNFNQLTTIEGSNNSNQLKEYRWLDESKNENLDVLYYRIKQTDNNGLAKTYNTVSTDCGKISQLELIYGQNIDQNLLDIYFSAKKVGSHQFTVYDVLGKLILNDKANIEITGKQKVSFPLNNITKGIYFISVSDGTQTVVKKVVLQ